jgi:hypothetical protein
MSEGNWRSQDPLFQAIDDLRDFDTEWIQALPKSAEAALERRLRRLRLAVAAAAELEERHEEPTPFAMKLEMDRLNGEFSFRPELLLVLAHELHLDEDLERAHTVERAYYKMMFEGFDQPAG